MIKHGDIISSVFTICLGVLSLLSILSQPRLTVFADSSAGSLGPGFFPFMCSGLLIVLGVALFIRGLLRRGQTDLSQLTEEKKQNLKTMLLIAGSCALFIAAWKITNQFMICLFVYSVAVNKLLKRSIRFSVLFSVVITAFVYFLFCRGFSVTFRV